MVRAPLIRMEERDPHAQCSLEIESMAGYTPRVNLAIGMVPRRESRFYHDFTVPVALLCLIDDNLRICQ
ncbi:hypothetical protein GmHk_10G030137 [Glycine max]|nr:hypothetical protein GmHk_10G030137 [Glycine max]